MKTELIATSVKLPADLTKQIDEMCSRDRRSRNQQINLLLEQALEARGIVVTVP
jgi:metal-responsive CopG/Arc/MetJ family transcriptional regulator